MAYGHVHLSWTGAPCSPAMPKQSPGQYRPAKNCVSPSRRVAQVANLYLNGSIQMSTHAKQEENGDVVATGILIYVRQKEKKEKYSIDCNPIVRNISPLVWNSFYTYFSIMYV